MRLLLITCLFLAPYIPLTSQESWTLSKDEHQIKVWTRPCEGSAIKEFKMEAVMEESQETVIATLIDIPNITEWYMYVSEVNIDSIIGNNRAKYLILFDLPWPVRDRFVDTDARIEMQDGIAKVSITASKNGRKEYKGNVKVSVMRASYEIKALSENQTLVTHYGHMEPAGLIPAWLANSGVSDGPLESFLAFRKRMHLYRDTKIPDFK